MKELLSSCKMKPDVVELEIHPFNQQPELVALCRANNIQVLEERQLPGRGGGGWWMRAGGMKVYDMFGRAGLGRVAGRVLDACCS